MNAPDTPPAASPRRWPAVLAAAVCVSVLATVVAFALGGDRGVGSEKPTQDSLEHALHPDASTGTSGRLPGPRMGTGLEGCITTDLDRLPRLSFLLEKGEFDFGLIRQGERREQEVTFTNTGDGLLCVTRVGTGCGCLKARFKNPAKRRYNKGERGVIILVVDTTGREGLLQKTVDVLSNDPEAPTRPFKVRCDISQAVVASPTTVSFGRQPKNAPAVATLILKSPKTDPAWTVTAVTGTRRYDGTHYVNYTYTVESIELNDPRFRQFRVTIKHPGLPLGGTFRDSILIRTTHKERPELLISAQKQTSERIEARPPRLPFGFVRPGAKRPARTIRLLPGGSSVVFEIKAVEVHPAPGQGPLPGKNGGFVVNFGTRAGVAFVEVDLRPKSAKPGLYQAVLVIYTTDAEMPVVRVPMTATIQGVR